MNRFNLIGLITLIALVGCNNPMARRSANYEIDVDLHSKISIVSGIFELETASNEAFLHDDKSDYHITIRYGQLASDTLAVTLYGDDENCPITLSTDLNPEKGVYTYQDLSTVTIHEIGHCFGLGHSPNPSDVMYFAHSSEQNSFTAFLRFVDQLNYSREHNVP